MNVRQLVRHLSRHGRYRYVVAAVVAVVVVAVVVVARRRREGIMTPAWQCSARCAACTACRRGGAAAPAAPAAPVVPVGPAAPVAPGGPPSLVISYTAQATNKGGAVGPKQVITISTHGHLNWGRLQFLYGDGYCGECCFQVLMMPFGVWFPQEFVRRTGNKNGNLSDDIYPDDSGARTNIHTALERLKINYNLFSGSTFTAFRSWGQGLLRQGYGLMAPIYSSFSLEDDGEPQWTDHIIPFVGISTDNAAWYAFTLFRTDAVAHNVAAGGCKASDKKIDYNKGGCLPTKQRFGCSLLGPKYAGIGPPVEIKNLNHLAEGPSETNSMRFTKVTMECDVRCHKLVPGRAYRVYRVVGFDNMPTSPSPGALRGDVVASFQASGPEHVFRSSFESQEVACFICVNA